jgi:hypothetical protein
MDRHQHAATAADGCQPVPTASLVLPLWMLVLPLPAGKVIGIEKHPELAEQVSGTDE